MMKTLGDYIEDMLLYKESIGYSKKTYEYDLMRFRNFIESKKLNVSNLNEDIVLSWCTCWESETSNGARRRIQTVRELLKYISAVGVDCYVIPSSFLPRPVIKTPHIFSDNELLSIFDVCDRLSYDYRSPHRHVILPALLRLIFFCGLRPNEGRELHRADIDFNNGIILIRKNKSHKERYVALSDDVLQMIGTYHSETIGIFPESIYFFPTPNGGCYDHHWLKHQFQMIRERANLTTGGSKAVVYSLRHRYATTVLMKWLNEGADINAKLPYLSSYMGHTHFSNTAYYIHLLPENLIRSTAIDWSHFSDLIPEVAEDE